MGNSDIVTSIINPGPGESVDYQVGTTGGGGEGTPAPGGPATGGGGEGTDQGFATGYWVERLREERTRHHAVELAHEAMLKELSADCDRLLQRAERAEKETVRWFNMSKELLAVAGEFAKLLGHP